METGAHSEKLEKIVRSFAQELPADIRLQVHLRKVEKAPLSVIWQTHDEPSEHLACTRIAGAVEKRQRTVLVTDSEKDSLLRGLEVPTLSSAICVPIFDEDKYLIGLLYGESRERKEAFSAQDRFKWEAQGRRLGPVLGRLRSTFQAQKKAKKTPYDFLFSPLTLVFAGVLLVMSFFWVMAPADTPPPPDRAAQKNSTAGPHKVAQRYAQYLKEENFHQAWLLLDPVLQTRWPEEQFTQRHQDWLKNEQNKAAMDRREVSRIQRSAGAASVTLFPHNEDKEPSKWVWEFRETSQGWKLSKLEGPVDSPEESH